MITSLRLVDFKNFADETLRVGPFTVIVGTNASGKSNIRDAFRFLHGIGRGYTLAEILGGRFGNGRQAEWERIRGGNQIIRFDRAAFRIVSGTAGLTALPKRSAARPAFRLELGLRFDQSDVLYTIEVGTWHESAARFVVTREELWIDSREVFTSRRDGSAGMPDALDSDRTQDRKHVTVIEPDPLLLRMGPSEGKNSAQEISVDARQPALTQIPGRQVAGDHRDRVEQVIDCLASMRFLELDPYMMRQPVLPDQQALGDSGVNLPAVLHGICADRKRKRTLVGWIRGLTPTDVQDLEFPLDPITGRIHLIVREKNERRFIAESASDGTLRLFGVLAALFGPEPANLYFFEDIDDGLHPSRLYLLLELIERETVERNVQVVTTTHSPDLLAQANDRTFEDMSLVCRRDDSENTVIRRVADLPDAGRLRRSQGLGRLHATGWMEDMIAFEEDDEDDGE